MSCPLCGAESELAFTTTDRNRALSDERFRYERCLSCGSFFLAEVPADLERYYPKEYYELPGTGNNDRAMRVEAPRLALLAKYVSSTGRLIEVGPGPGYFARAARDAGFDVTAVERDPHCCEALESGARVRTILSSAPEDALATLEPARVIAMWHVVEHLDRPWQVLEVAAARLERSGVLALAMPNPQSFQFRMLRGRWAHVDAPRHLFLIPYPALRARLEQLGLAVLEVTTSDRVGLALNAMGWQYALRRFPARRDATRLVSGLSSVVTAGLAPLERRGLNGTAYTVIAARPDK